MMKRIAWPTAVATAVAVTTSLGLLATAQPALAGGCDERYRNGYNGFFVTVCTSGPGVYYRARARCGRIPNDSLQKLMRGEWQQEGRPRESIAACAGEYPYYITGSGWTEWS